MSTFQLLLRQALQNNSYLSTSPKSIAKKIVSVIRDKIGFQSREFETYDDAFEYCFQRTSDCYESSLLSQYKFEKFSNFLKDNGNLFSSPSANLLLFSISLFLRKEGAGVPCLIDFGGSCGGIYCFALKNIWR